MLARRPNIIYQHRHFPAQDVVDGEADVILFLDCIRDGGHGIERIRIDGAQPRSEC